MILPGPYLEGIFQSTNIILASVALVLVLLLFRHYKHPEVKPFRYLALAMLVFIVLLLFAALRSFGIYENPYITHVLPTPILLILLYAVYLEIKLRAKK